VCGEDAGGEDGDGVNRGCRPGSGRHGAHSTAVAAPAAASASPELRFHALHLQRRWERSVLSIWSFSLISKKTFISRFSPQRQRTATI
jgi:CRISPR/Cas system-associated protein Csm6